MSVEQFIGHRRLRSVPQRSATGLYLPIADDRAKRPQCNGKIKNTRLLTAADNPGHQLRHVPGIVNPPVMSPSQRNSGFL